MALLRISLSWSALHSEKQRCCEPLPQWRCSSQGLLVRPPPVLGQEFVSKAVLTVVCALRLGDEDGDAGVCAEGWVHPHIIGSIATVMLGAARGC
jgi:hypothetical protein